MFNNGKRRRERRIDSAVGAGVGAALVLGGAMVVDYILGRRAAAQEASAALPAALPAPVAAAPAAAALPAASQETAPGGLQAALAAIRQQG